MSDLNEQVELVEQAEAEEPEIQYEGTPEELTSFSKAASSGPGPAVFNRKKVMMTISIAFAGVVLMGILFSTMKSKRQQEADDESGRAASVPRDFLQHELDRSNRAPAAVADDTLSEETGEPVDFLVDENGLPIAVPVDLRDPPPGRTAELPPPVQQGQQAPQGEYAGGRPPPEFVANFSPMVPQVEGRLFASFQGQDFPANQLQRPPNETQQAISYFQDRAAEYQMMGQQQPAPPAQNTFFNAETGGNILTGNFLPPDILWIGTIIPAVLETAINTDLPGQVAARVTQNIYDSRTGRKLLIPQGTILIARYNSSVSYAQSRVQIVWDILIRPDGYQLELQGMNAVDPRGMAGLQARYRENWFEYIKAAGIITMFSIANSSLAAEVANYGSDDMAAAAVASNAEFGSQLSGNIVNRAMDISPTLTVPSGERINIMLNKNIFLPPVQDPPVTSRYILGGR